MRKIALVDLDDTLFDIKRFKKAYFDYLSAWFPPDVVTKTYEEAKAGGYFDADKHCTLLDIYMSSVSGHSGDTCLYLEDWFEAEFEFFIECVFPDVELFLKTLIHNGYEIHILTLGTEWFQKAKIENSGLTEYISGVIVTQDPTKVSAILNICDPTTDEVLLFDDFWTVIDSMKIFFPKIYAVHVLRRNEYLDKRAARADAFARNLGEATGAILSRPR